jgi:hypothetical protein
MPSKRGVDLGLYRHYLDVYVQEAIENSDGSNAGILSYLRDIQVRGLLVKHKEEKQKALDEARKAFEEHRHWPTQIVLSHLGVEVKK